MNFLCDVHISYKLVNLLKSWGFEALHLNEILSKSETTDSEICRYADKYNYAVITKDLDFQNSYMIKNTPKKLVKINLGNISNDSLIKLFIENREVFYKLELVESFFVTVDESGFKLQENR